MTVPIHPTPQNTLSPRERILETARALFYTRGVNNVGIDLIILESGVAKATLYKHFKSKDDLILAYMGAGSADWLEWLQKRVEHFSPNTQTRLIAVWDALEEWFALPHFRGCSLGNVVTELAASAEHPTRRILLEHKEKVRAFFEELAVQTGMGQTRAISERWMVLLEGATTLAARERTGEIAVQARAIAQILLESQAMVSPRVEPEKANSMLEHLDFEF